ncbi:RraA family protein [Serinicoccus sp. LYQ131]|uniref:RraA family protein n=1 Tax=Serinicoccus sp. LYQ131 TaxID=3378797 RepID=UPI003852E3E0
MQIEPAESVMTALTPRWVGERFPGGRPRVSDEVLDRLRGITVEQAWKPMKHAGYHHQFADGWRETNPGHSFVGRAVTAQFLPFRPDFDEVILEAGRREERSGGEVVKQNWWVVESLEHNDVMVVDLFGKIEHGTFVGDNLATAVSTRTGTGAIIQGGIRDAQGIAEITTINILHQGSHPTGIGDVTIAGLNVPVRLGGVTVLPGDVILATSAGVSVIPPHLAETVAAHAEGTQMRDIFGKSRLADRVYTSAEIDIPEWSHEVESDFQQWLLARR